uniref:Uncharacterized protein n=1 Tax=Alexandrium monilatum TaxID=311494 RepID=A0A6T1K706_9DINO
MAQATLARVRLEAWSPPPPVANMHLLGRHARDAAAASDGPSRDPRVLAQSPGTCMMREFNIRPCSGPGPQSEGRDVNLRVHERDPRRCGGGVELERRALGTLRLDTPEATPGTRGQLPGSRPSTPAPFLARRRSSSMELEGPASRERQQRLTALGMRRLNSSAKL